MKCELDLRGLKEKEIYLLGEDFCAAGGNEETLSFTNYYMQKNGTPFFGVGGEFHYSRMREERWEDEIIKMRMGGINVVTTYIFWNHHEEEEGCFCFEGRRDLRRFVQLCEKHGLYVILRVGPFDHGEVRNGGIPDWMYGKPFEVRSLDEGFLAYVRRLYTQIAQQVQGMFFCDGGPVIAVQLDNEYMHSSSNWEITTGISNEWISSGTDGEAYIHRLKELALECGLTPAFFTCTAWGGAVAPDFVMPLWGGYAFRPWLFYSHQGEHPATEEYVYQDYHKNGFVCTDDFTPQYEPETRPYACCEMGGGMMCCYYYRFQYPYKSVDALANIKLGSGCNFLGYYMFQGGSNPVGKNGTFLNESQVPKISYDYQAALGEFGQIRESYQRLKSIHYFVSAFAQQLCVLPTILPKGAEQIAPKDVETLRYTVRSDGCRGFLFLNNYQDHFELPDRHADEITLHLESEDLTWQIDLAGEENAILPFHLDMSGIDLVQANAQLLTKTVYNGEETWVFFVPDGMKGSFVFEDGVRINGEQKREYHCQEGSRSECFLAQKDAVRIHVLVLSRKMADQMYLLRDGSLLFAEGAVLEDAKGLRLETGTAENTIYTYPADRLAASGYDVVYGMPEGLGAYRICVPHKSWETEVKQVGPSRYTVDIPADVLDGVKDALLQIRYTGDIGTAFLDGHMISDNFCNGAVWEIGLRDFEEALKKDPVTIYIVPVKKGAKVKVESSMAARSEEVDMTIAELGSVKIQPVYEIRL